MTSTQSIDSLVSFALDLGVTKAVQLDARCIITDPRVRMKCVIPTCMGYGKNLMCPPNVMPFVQFQEILRSYKRAILVQLEVSLSDKVKEDLKRGKGFMDLYREDREYWREHIFSVQANLHRIVTKIEKRANDQGFYLATALSAGPCNLCQYDEEKERMGCVGVKSRKSCRRPLFSHPSMEAMGIDVIKTAKMVGLPFEHPIREKVVWNGLVLID